MIRILSASAAVALFVLVSPRLSPAAPDVQRSSCAPRDASDLLHAFFGQPSALREFAERPRSIRIETLIATVPEPELGFDGAVAALTIAFQQSGYTLDRSWLPWLPAESRKDEQVPHAACQENAPGVLLFRSLHSNSEQLTLVCAFLVGETPTSGLHKEAFTQAIEAASRMMASEHDRKKLRILGPSFSGSALSMGIALAQWPNLDFQVMSGRATSAEVKDVIAKKGPLGQDISFSTTVISSELLKEKFYDYLATDLGVDSDDVALLVESTTEYGQAAERSEGSRDRKSKRPRLILPVPLHISRLERAWEKGQKPPAEKAPTDGVRQGLSPPERDTLRDVIPTMAPQTLHSEERALATILTTIFAEKIRYVGLQFTDPQDQIFLATQIRKYCPDVVIFSFESDLLYTLPEHRMAMRGMMLVSTYPLFTRNQEWSFPYAGWHHRLQFAHGTDQGLYNAAVVLLGRPDLLLDYASPFADLPKSPPWGLRPQVWISAVGLDGLFPLAVFPVEDKAGVLYSHVPGAGERDARSFYFPYEQGSLTLALILIGIFSAVSCFEYFRKYHGGAESFARDAQAEAALDEKHYALWRFFEIYGRRKDTASRQLLYMFFAFLSLLAIEGSLTAIYFVQLRSKNCESMLYSPSACGLDATTWCIAWLCGACVALLGVVVVDVFVRFVILKLKTCQWICRCFQGEKPAPASAAVPKPTRIDRLAGWIKKTFFFKSKSTAEELADALRCVCAWTMGSIGLLLLTFLVFWRYHKFVNDHQFEPNFLIFMRRSAQVGYGLSPAVPFVLLCGVIHLYAYQGLRRLYLLERLAALRPGLPDPLKISERIAREATDILKFLSAKRLRTVVAWFLLTLVGVVFAFSNLVTLEKSPVQVAFHILLPVVGTTIVYSAYRFYILWAHFRHFLHLLNNHKMMDAFDRMPAGLARSVGLQLLEEVPELARVSILKRHWRVLINHAIQLDLKPLATILDTGPEMQNLLEQFQLRAIKDKETESRAIAQGAPLSSGEVTGNISWTSGQALQILQLYWRGRPLGGAIPTDKPLGDRFGAGLQTANTADLYARALPDALHLWLRLAEDFIAVQVVAFINALFPQLRNSLAFMTSAMILLLLTLSTYPFQPQHLLSILAWVLIGGVAGLSIWVFVQMERDDILSRIAKTEPGKVDLNWQFVSWVLTYGLIPLLGLVTTQIPEVRGWVFSWVEPALRALK